MLLATLDYKRQQILLKSGTWGEMMTRSTSAFCYPTSHSLGALKSSSHSSSIAWCCKPPSVAGRKASWGSGSGVGDGDWARLQTMLVSILWESRAVPSQIPIAFRDKPALSASVPPGSIKRRWRGLRGNREADTERVANPPTLTHRKGNKCAASHCWLNGYSPAFPSMYMLIICCTLTAWNGIQMR